MTLSVFVNDCPRRLVLVLIGPITPNMVSGHYRAPELLLGLREYGGGVDVWAMGCVFGELLQRETVFKGNNELDQLNKITAMLGHPTPEEWPEYDQLYRSAFHRRPQQRATPASKSLSKTADKQIAEADAADATAAAEASTPAAQQDFGDLFAAVVERAGTPSAPMRQGVDGESMPDSSRASSSAQTKNRPLKKLPQHFVTLRKRFSRYGFNGTGRLSGVLGKPVGLGRPHASTPTAGSSASKITSLSERGFDLLCRCFTANPARRITAAEALAHPWFVAVNEPKGERIERTQIQRLVAQHAHKVQLEKAKKHGVTSGIFHQQQIGFRSGFAFQAGGFQQAQGLAPPHLGLASIGMPGSGMISMHSPFSGGHRSPGIAHQIGSSHQMGTLLGGGLRSPGHQQHQFPSQGHRALASARAAAAAAAAQLSK